MLPVLGTVSKYPSPNFHFAGLPSRLSQLLKSFPLKSTVASDGGRPAWSCVLHSPGMITGGCGRSRSCSFHFSGDCKDWALTLRFVAIEKMATKNPAVAIKADAVTRLLRMVFLPWLGATISGAVKTDRK